VLALALPAPASAELAPPWDGDPISPGLGPTYGEAWCEAPTPGSGESRQQSPPLALMPGEAVGCTLERFRAEARAARVPGRFHSAVIGKSVQGRDLHGVVVNALETRQQRRDFARWLELRALMTTKPELAQSKLAQWGPNVKLPIVVEANIHGNEEEGTDAAMQIVRDLVTTPRGVNPAVDDLLDHAFLIVHPTINPDGRFLETRANANGFDLNRDLIVQGQPEVRTSITNLLRWLPPVGLTMHGYRSPTQAQAMTKPHNPGYEYDLLLGWNQRRVDANQADLAAAGMGIARPVNDWNENAATAPPPVGPAYAEGWDDWGPFYTAGHASVWALDIQTIEMCNTGPGCDGRFGSKRAQYISFYSSARYWTAHRNAILHDQVEIYRRGVADAERVNCCDDPLLAQRGFTEDQHNWMVEYPKAYVIPFGGGGQRSDAEANRLAKWLLDNSVEVHRATRDFTWGGTTYPKGSYVIGMDQAFRGLALTVLSAGQDISDRIARLYAPPGAWSPGHIWGADVVEIPRGDASFDPRTTRAFAPNELDGGVPSGDADWYAVTPRGPTEVRAILGLLRDGVDGEVAEEPFDAAGERMPAGSLIFSADPRLEAAGESAGFDFQPGNGAKPPTTKLAEVPRIAVLVDSAAPAMNDTLWALRRTFGSDAEFVSVVAGPGSLQNAPTDPLEAFDVIYNAGQNFPAEANATARSRLRAFFERGGGYIGTSQSANNFAFLSGGGLVDGALTQGSQPAGGGIARWSNAGADGPLTGGYPAQDTLYLPTNVTYFTSLPAGAVVDGRYLDSTTDLFLAGLWRDRNDEAAGAPVIVHGETTASSRYLALATNPFSRGDAEREWTLVAQAAFWGNLTDED
jgi:zinc carboxypeptidase